MILTTGRTSVVPGPGRERWRTVLSTGLPPGHQPSRSSWRTSSSSRNSLRSTRRGSGDSGPLVSRLLVARGNGGPNGDGCGQPTVDSTHVFPACQVGTLSILKYRQRKFSNIVASRGRAVFLSNPGVRKDPHRFVNIYFFSFHGWIRNRLQISAAAPLKKTPTSGPQH